MREEGTRGAKDMQSKNLPETSSFSGTSSARVMRKEKSLRPQIFLD